MKYEKFDYLFYIVVVLLLLVLAMAAHGQQSSGGSFTITKTVVAGGGQASQNAPMNASATIGQTVAGNRFIGGQFSLYTGFWTPEDFAPTAAPVSVSGRVITADGRGIRNAHVSITFPNGETRSTLCGESGRFIFGDLEVGGTYIFAVTSKRFTFSNPAQVLTINEERDDVYFVADN